MELRQLKHLVLFADTGSVSEVAKLVYLTQPSVTRSLQSLEDEIGIEIFYRERNRLFLTEAGEKVVSLAKKVVDDAAELQAEIEGMKRLQTSLSVLSIAPIPLYKVASVLQGRLKQPHVTRDIVTEDEALKALAEHRCDIAIIQERRHVGIELYPLFHEQILLAVPNDHTLANKDEVHFRDLEGSDILIFNKGGFWTNFVKAKMPGVRFILQDDERSYWVLVKNASVPYFISSHMKQRTEADGTHKIIPFAEESTKIRLALAVKATSERSIHRTAARISRYFEEERRAESGSFV